MVGNKQIRTFHISTYGCQMNFADSSTLSSIMTARGYKHVQNEIDADLLIFNTCSVRDKAERRVIGRLGEIKRFKRNKPQQKVAVVGCMAQRLGKEFLKVAPNVNYVLGPDRLFELPDVIENVEGASSIMTTFGYENMDAIVPSKETPFSAFVTISRGCNNRCAYCIVPYVRGNERAHSADQIVKNVRSLVSEGVIEITLLGQNVNSYKHSNTDFPMLLDRLINETDIHRLRFMTSHPKDLSERLIEIIAQQPRIMPHIHLPLQSGANRVLKMMGRGYTIEHYLKIIESLRRSLDYVAITTDLIVGFPTETEREFEQTLDAVRQIRYDMAFMFRYSVRPGTLAAGYEDDVQEEEKIRRLKKLIALQQQIGYEQNQREVNQTRHCLIEGTSRRDIDVLRARTEGNKTVLFEAESVGPGDIVPIQITSADAYTLHGRIEVSL
ncbi:MAG: tRNA (N6-isopentenyl adenosine(37)-C2)-methylthiotransferase MiaB [candidate division Zixibacteria bacterium]|nr:tRNA (N6-isopentenyl adenosine(37)-C2)-methylthiotransferase MiaB [candidate division Zixibacteria bacterium]